MKRGPKKGPSSPWSSAAASARQGRNVNAAKLRTDSAREADTQAAHLTTDERRVYRTGREVRRPTKRVNHSREEYVRGKTASPNTVENYFSILKRGIMASISIATRNICTAISPSSISAIRTASSSGSGTRSAPARDQGAEGKRLTYRRTGSQKAAAPTA